METDSNLELCLLFHSLLHLINIKQKTIENKSIPILEKALKNDSKNYSFYRELGYAYSKLNKLDMAEKTYKKGISLSDSNFEKSEMAVNMAQGYFLIKNKAKFDEWAKITKTYAEKGSQYAQYIDFFEKEWNSKR